MERVSLLCILLLSLINDVFGFEYAPTTFKSDTGDGLTYQLISEENLEVSISSCDWQDPYTTHQVTIPTKVTYEGIEYTVTTIGVYAFRNCNIGDVIIPETVTTIEPYAFRSCIMSRVEIPETVTNIGEGIFYGASLTSIKLPNNMTNIPKRAFSYTKKLYSIDIPKSVTTIRTEAFSNSSIKTFEISEYVNSIGDYAFEATDITGIVIPESVTDIGIGLFKDCKILTEVSLPSLGTSIPDETFYGCKSLSSYKILPQITEIGASAFEGTGITEINIPATVSNIGANAFNSCDSLTSLTFEEHPSPITFGDYVFGNCIALKELTLPKQITGLNNNMFACCSKLTNIFVDPDNPVYTDIDGVVYNKDKTELIMLPSGRSQYEIPEGVTSIADYACYSMERVSKITLPSSIERIGREAFYSLKWHVSGARIYCYSTTPPVADENAFSSRVLYNFKLYIPKQSVESYASTSPWNKFSKYDTVVVNSIHDVSSDVDFSQPQDVYNLNGVLILRNASDANITTLPSGVYIIGGNKVIIR